MSTVNEAQKLCIKALSRIASKQQIIDALGIPNPDSLDEEFWKIQFLTATNRAYRYCCLMLGLEAGIERVEQSDENTAKIAELANVLADKGKTYRDIRHWWFEGGDFLSSQAIAFRREQKYLSSMRLVVLVFFETGRPLYLSCQLTEKGPFCEKVEEAKAFEVQSVSELSKEALEKTAEKFDGLKHRFGATRVKVLPHRV